MAKLPELKTAISAVTIYRDGAKIERTGSMELQPGTHKLQISSLTRYLDKESVRVSGRGHATILSFDTVDTTVEVSGYEKLDTLLKQREELVKKQRQIQSELERIAKRMAFYSQVLDGSAGEFSRWIPAGETEVDRLSSLETLVTKQQDQLYKIQIKFQDDLEKLQKEIAILTREIDKFRSEVNQYEITHSVYINVESHKLGKCEFTLSYFVSRAAWAPTYDFILAEDTTDMTMYTVVHNNTQEDWDNVQLTVSTASRRPATISEPHPYLIQVYTPPPPRPAARAMRKEMTYAPAASGAATGDYAKDEAEELAMLEEPLPDMAPPPVVATSVEVGGVFVFVLPDAVKVPSDGEPHAFRTSHSKMKSDRKFFWNAVDFAEAVEVTTIENGETVLLPGKARVYCGDEYLGETHLELIAPNEKVDVGMRFTYDLKVEKKLVEKSTEKKGLTKGNIARDYTYTLTVKNYRKKMSAIKVMDRIPHSDSEVIKVQDRKFRPEPEKDELGVLTWKLEVSPEGEFQISYSFQVEYPRGRIITPPLP